MPKLRIVYTAEQLKHLRNSPLIAKPDSLPSIEQWIDQPQENGQRKQRTQSARADESGPMGNFGSQRPSLLQTRQVRTSNGEDIVLGPPKTSFASSRNIRKSGEDGGSAAQTPQEDDFSLEAMSARTRTHVEDDSGRRRGFGADKDKEGWSTAKNGRSYENRGPAGEKERGFGRNIRDRGDRTTQGDEDPTRRNGFGQRSEQRWSREGDDKRPPRLAGREGGWRDREKRNDRDTFKDQPQEKEPEWMDEPYVDDEPQARNAADFEKWKAKMKGQKYEPAEPTPEPVISEKSPAMTKAPAPLLADAMFGTWGDSKKVESPGQPEATPPKPAGNKKASRFASMFAPKEEPRQAVPEQVAAPLAPSSLPTEDQQGFQNILMKLRGKSFNLSQEAPASSPSAGPPPGFSPGLQESRPDQGSSPNPLLQAMLASKSDSRPDSRPGSNYNPMSALSQGPPSAGDAPHHRRQESHGSLPHRNISTPEAQNIQNLLAGQRSQKQAALSKDSEFLLNLIQTKSANRPTPQPQPEHDPNFQLFLDQPPRPQTQGPPQRQPPGLMQGHQEPMFSPNHGQEPPQDRRPNTTHPPPGFFDGPHPPPNQIPPHQRRPQNGPPGFGPPPSGADFFNPEDPRHHQDRQGGPPHNPPPGFLPHMRGPPGMPGMFPHGGPPPGGPNGPPPPQFMQQRGPPGLGSLPGHGQPPPEHFGPGGPGGPGIVPPPGFPAGPNYVPGAPPGFGPPPQQQRGGLPGLNMAALGMQGFGPAQGMGIKSPGGEGLGPGPGGPGGPGGIRSPIEGYGGFGRGR
ncbi:hypothetical protein B9Z65_5239 [Elsinoe australis]|uniref:Uncharacterized protein n=1 Tax=Elsinoe australis TaxID=40998 RepID=A0A2P7ZDL4_9PEZI|nr:hypothetical protein B9Z65_5239 [Elsinoe australis]